MSFSALKGPGEVAAEVIMSRAGFNGTFLIVEGDDDSRFFSSRIAQNDCELLIAGGKSALLGGVQRLDAQHIRGVLGVCDDDCASLNGQQSASPNVVVTECRDLDTMLVRSPALERTLGEYGDRAAIQRFEAKHGPVRDSLTRLALPFGRLRWLSDRNRLGIDFQKLSPHKFVKPDWSFRVDDLIDAAAAQIGQNAQQLRASVDGLPNVDPWLVCQGHDLLAILAIGLGSGGVLGHSKRPPPDSKKIAAGLRQSLDNAVWLASRLASDIRFWEKNNPPFQVF